MSRFGALFGLSLVLFASLRGSALAAEQPIVKSVLTFTTALGYSETTQVHIKGRNIYVNGVRLSRTESIFLADALRSVFLREEKRLPKKSCPAGVYEHTVTGAGRQRFVTGCLTDQRFQVLRSSFLRLQAGNPLLHSDWPGVKE